MPILEALTFSRSINEFISRKDTNNNVKKYKKNEEEENLLLEMNLRKKKEKERKEEHKRINAEFVNIGHSQNSIISQEWHFGYSANILDI